MLKSSLDAILMAASDALGGNLDAILMTAVIMAVVLAVICIGILMIISMEWSAEDQRELEARQEYDENAKSVRFDRIKTESTPQNPRPRENRAKTFADVDPN